MLPWSRKSELGRVTCEEAMLAFPGRGRTTTRRDGWRPRWEPPSRAREILGLKASEPQSKAWKGAAAVARVSSPGSPKRPPEPFRAEVRVEAAHEVGLSVNSGRSM